MDRQLSLFDAPAAPPPPAPTPAPAPVRMTVAEKKRAAGKGRYTLKRSQFEWDDARGAIRVFSSREWITVTWQTARAIRLVGKKPASVQISRRANAVVGCTWPSGDITDEQWAQMWKWHVEIVQAEAARERARKGG